ncbi:hypothetical protein E2C01_028113 [Portunus trituberculatus]|uniref:Uncharacterized protein n=1 Tax=Portunus trituberculatus TaxID=210409 RepID=A0A5B7EQR1_PORTR|nr:hypothetical protein [Portunus trituberculatus]
MVVVVVVVVLPSHSISIHCLASRKHPPPSHPRSIWFPLLLHFLHQSTIGHASPPQYSHTTLLYAIITSNTDSSSSSSSSSWAKVRSSCLSRPQ